MVRTTTKYSTFPSSTQASTTTEDFTSSSSTPVYSAGTTEKYPSTPTNITSTYASSISTEPNTTQGYSASYDPTPSNMYVPQIRQEPGMPFNFSWVVKHKSSYNNYAHQSQSNGKVTTGSYNVALPDGRVQIVTYKADENGYVADVKYKGEAKYPAPKTTYPVQPKQLYPQSNDFQSTHSGEMESTVIPEFEEVTSIYEMESESIEVTTESAYKL